MGTTKRGKGPKRMAVADGPGLPVAVHTAAATPHEVTLVPDALTATCTTERPARLSGDQADESEPLDVALAAVGIELIAPPRATRKRPKTQDGRPLRRDKRRGKVARLFAGLQNFRRVLVRHEFHAGRAGTM